MRPEDFYNLLIEHDINCFCGVPDSLLKPLCAYITDNAQNHTITANEGNAIGLAAGHYLATGNSACVYMQNSGIGNCVNPLLSLTDEEVYNIPLLMLIGWRGEPNIKDEPQHIKQGKVTNKLLEVMGIKYDILPYNFEEAKPIIEKALHYMKKTNKPVAFIIKKGLFEEYTLHNKVESGYNFVREEAIETVLKHLSASDVIVSTTGHISREVYETRERLGQSHKQDFLTVGSMGHSSSIALGIALSKPDRNIYCFDGDGAFLMHAGASAVNASKRLPNFKHIVFNNEAHDSVGSQPTVAHNMNLQKLAKNVGYSKYYYASNKTELENILPYFISDIGTAFLEIKVKCGARSDLGRPKEKPSENKMIFMDNLKQIDFCYHGAIENLSKILKDENANKVLVFRGNKSYDSIKNIIENELKNISVDYYSDFSTNPKEEEIKKAVDSINKDFDVIVAIGGGSVVDFAKAYKYYTQSDKKLVAIPTTCGTGAESTQFAVVYINGIKHSLDNPRILPNYAIVDSQFVENNPKYLKACTALDALCQAIESFWAVKANRISQHYASEALKFLKENIITYINTNDKIASENMAKAAHLTGKAINVSRTTAAHALSYTITSKYGIPHGHAVALSILPLVYLISNVNEDCVNDTRGIGYIKNCIADLDNIFNGSVYNYLKELFRKIDIETNFKKIGITNVDSIIDGVNIERLNNNPIKLSKEDIYLMFSNNILVTE